MSGTHWEHDENKINPKPITLPPHGKQMGEDKR